jgi:putative SOS response-associated peptidase YedK
VGLLTWGLVPGWRDEPEQGLINARSESVSEKPSFREAFERRRCLVPALGFYEWKKEPDGKRPFWIHPADGGLISFAGIWERWSGPGMDPRYTFAVLTTTADGDVARVHDRMPVFIEAADRAAWLDRGTDREAALAIMGRGSSPSLVCHPVSTRVNSPQEDDAGLIEPLM